MTVYATSGDLSGVTVADVDECIAAASALVDDACTNDRYGVDDQGAPTDSTLAGAMTAAVVIQIKAWAALGIDSAVTTGVPDQVRVTASKALDGASIGYAVDGKAAQASNEARAAALRELVPAALRALKIVGLASTRVWSYG